MSGFLDDTSWVLVEGPAPVPGATVTADFAHGEVSGSSGCNRYRVRYSADPVDATGRGAFRIDGAAATTLMACDDDRTALEADVHRRLADAVAYRVTADGRLEVLDADGGTLLGWRPAGSDDLEGEWTAVMVHRPTRHAVMSVDGDVTVTFEAGTVHGHAGVNRFQGPCTVDGTTVVVGALATTRMAGPPDQMAQESDVLAALRDTVAFRVTAGHVTLLRADGGIALDLVRGRR